MEILTLQKWGFDQLHTDLTSTNGDLNGFDLQTSPRNQTSHLYQQNLNV
jgi:hypothetical protein